MKGPMSNGRTKFRYNAEGKAQDILSLEKASIMREKNSAGKNKKASIKNRKRKSLQKTNQKDANVKYL